MESQPLLDKPVTIGRAVRKAAASATGVHGFISGKSNQDGETEPDDGSMYLEEAIQEIMEAGENEWCFGPWEIIVVLMLSINLTVLALETNMLTFVAPCAVADFFSSADDIVWYEYESALWTALYIGNGLGCLFLGPLADMIGRWRTLLISNLGVLVFAMLSATSTSYSFLYWTRFFVGVFEGMAIIGQDLLVEVISSSNRGTILNITNLAWGLGSTLVCLMAKWILPVYGWKVLVAACAVPFVLATALLFLLVESPRWYMEQGKPEKAMEALRTMAKRNGVTMPCNSLKVDYEILDDLRGLKGCRLWCSHLRRFFRGYRALFSRRLWKRTLCMGTAMFACYFAYTGVVVYDADVEGESGTAACSFDYDFTILVATSEIVGALVLFPLVDKRNLGIWGGRFGSQWISYTVAGISMLYLGYGKGGTFIWSYLGRAGASGGSGITFVAIAEWYPTVNRVSATCMAYFISLFGATFGTYWTYSTLTDPTICLGIFISCVFCVLPILFLPEQAQAALEDLDEPDADLGIGCNCRRVNCCGEDPDAEL